MNSSRYRYPVEEVAQRQEPNAQEDSSYDDEEAQSQQEQQPSVLAQNFLKTQSFSQQFKPIVLPSE